jgi:predicted nuclease of restriction endonuclease-like (RecB) superfamily
LEDDMEIQKSKQIQLISEIKDKIKVAQYRALLNVNEQLIKLYWDIGNDLNKNTAYGNNFIDTLAREIKLSFPDAKGYSARNLRYMKHFAKEITDQNFLQMVSAKLPWSHNLILIEKLKSMESRYWYGAKAIENGWSVTALEHQIATGLINRERRKKLQNFDKLLPTVQSELAIQTMKDPYIFDFVKFDEKMKERQIEDELVKNITNFLLEMGKGFAYMGHQYPLALGNDEFALDILFYNTLLHCYVVVDLKTKKFIPEYAGKMNFYLSLVDEKLKTEIDNPSIGLILCHDKNKTVAEFALKDMAKPIGVSEYRFTQELPDEIQKAFPEAEDWAKRIVIGSSND